LLGHILVTCCDNQCPSVFHTGSTSTNTFQRLPAPLF